MSVENIALSRLALMLVPVLWVLWLMHRWGDNAREGANAVARMILQLLAIGYLLDALFSADSLWVVPLVLLVMITASSWIGLRTVKQQRTTLFAYTLLALGAGGMLNLLLALLVLDASLLHDNRIVIPLAGMTFANGMTAISLAAERYATVLAEHGSMVDARNQAWNTALIPTINSLLAVGLVSLPGMMTGQILSGVDPLIAVRYQILIMALLLGTTGLSTALFLYMLTRQSRKA